MSKKSMKLSTIAIHAISCLAAAAAAAPPPPLPLLLDLSKVFAESPQTNESPGGVSRAVLEVAGGPPPALDPSAVGGGYDIPTKYCSNATLVANRATVAAITWDSVRSTTIFAASIGLLCLLGYELFRRDPLVGKYVYDRKRLTQPDRSPPPLMISRSLWRGDDAIDRTGGRGCSTAGRRPVCPALLEIVFVDLDSDYIRYSRGADDARKSREMRGRIGCCRSGRFHRNCRGNYRGRSSSSTTADEDGYEFYPDYNGEYSHVYVPGRDDASYSIGPKEPPVEADDSCAPSSPPEVRAVVEDEGVTTTTTTTVPTKRMNEYDLFPGEFIIKDT